MKDVYIIDFPNLLNKPLHLTGGNVIRSITITGQDECTQHDWLLMKRYNGIH